MIIFVNSQFNTDNSPINTNITNIDYLAITYELTYDNTSVLKALIRTVNDIETTFEFNARLISEKGKKEYKLNCYNTSDRFIECFSNKTSTFNLSDKYYLYYKKGEDGNYTFNEENILKDYKKISLVFKPEFDEVPTIFRDNRKIIVINNLDTMGGGYLYTIPKSKKIMHKRKDDFNKYIDYNNYIFLYSLERNMPNTLYTYLYAIKQGYYMINVKIYFTKDKIPIISHEEDLEKISNGNGKIESKTLAELLKLDFVSKFNAKYRNETILTLEKLLDVCRKNDTILEIDLGHLDYKTYFEDTKEYINILFDTIDKYRMSNSIIFEADSNPDILLTMNKIRNIYVSVLISGFNSIKNIKEKFSNFKGIIYNIEEIPEIKNISETKKYITSLGIKLKVGKPVNDIELAKKLQSIGVNYITTNKIHPFLIENEREFPLLYKCTQFDLLSVCQMVDGFPKMVDREKYSVYYSDNIYNISEDINETPIGEIIYLETNHLEHYYYSVKEYDFDKGILKLNLTIVIETYEQLTGKIGPEGYVFSAKDIYQYDFLCKGNGTNEVDCKIFKDDESKIRLEGNYSIYVIDNTSIYVPKKEIRFDDGDDIGKQNNNYKTYIYIIILVFIIIISINAINYYYKNKLNENFIRLNTEDN
jgi:glycerophosphoryl diester phosphodiesterase